MRLRATHMPVPAVAAIAALALVIAVPVAGAVPRASTTYSCTATVPVSGGETITYSRPITVHGNAPRTAAPNSKVSLTGVEFKLTIPARVINQVIRLSKKVSADVTTLDIVSTNRPATVNVAGKGIVISPLTLVSDATLTLQLPNPPTTVGPWTAGSAGPMSFRTGNVALTLTAAGKKVPVSCHPKPAVTISTTTVS
jgi:hypothetical protein